MITTKMFTITGMHCTSCAINIDGELEDTDGVKRAKTSYAKQKVEVAYDEAKIDSAKITEIIKNLGYEAVLTKE